ncbi:YcnI family protein [Marisediminicola sp. LYQ134]|uniref:YcnI family copper-binding membrane protein n=1 Tax=Marisediminicola sp. LYQ134 TaxID=3391061 RepID=UPI003982EB23
MNTRTITRLSVAGTAGLLLAVASPLAASAHVTIDPASAEPGSYTVITVKVPNESATAETESVEIALPTDTPFSSVRYVPVAGWTTELVRTTLPEPVEVEAGEITEAVTSVVFTAEPGSEIADGELQQFELSLGPVPDTGSIVLPATQTYTDGDVVSWSETEADAQYPAPVLYITDEPAGDDHGAHSSGDSADSNTDAADSASSGSTDAGSTETSAATDVVARVIGVVGFAVGAIGVVLALLARRKTAN